MNKRLYTIFLIALTFSACEKPGTSMLYSESFLELDAATVVTGSKTYGYLRQNDGRLLPSGFLVTLGSAHLPQPVNFSFEIDPSSTAVEGLHYTVESNSATIPAHSSTVELPITIIVDNIDPDEELDIVIRLVSGDVAVNPNYETAAHRLQVACDLDLEGVYDYYTTDIWCGGNPASGSVELIDLGDNTYTFKAWDFGSYSSCYGGSDPNWEGIQLVDDCGVLAVTGSDNYGGIWSFDTLTVNGPDLTFSWSNNYGEGGTTTLTRTDGTDWPELTL